MYSTSDAFRSEVQAELIRSLYSQGPMAMVGNLVIGGILVYVLWDTASHQILLLWLGALCAILILRSAQILAFARRRPSNERIHRWGIGAACGTLIVGLTWGSTPFLFLNPEEPLNLIVITVIMMGLSAGSIVNLASFLPSFFAFVVPTMGSLVVVLLLLHDDVVATTVGMLGIVAIAAFVVGGRNFNRVLRESLQLGFENLALRREAEDKTALLETTLQNMRQGISLVDLRGRLRMWNQRLFDLLGMQSKPAEEGQMLGELFEAANPPLVIGAEPRTEYQRHDGTVLEISQNRMPDGGSVLTYTDISDLKRREAALEVARQAAEQANAAKTRFLAAASHDLRQPIHALGLLFASLSDQVRSRENAGLLDQVEEAIDAIDSMLNSLLDISKLDAGIVRPSIGPVSVAALLRRLETEHQPIAKETGNELRIRPTDAIVRSDGSMLARILINLISNALLHTRNGRVLVGTRRRGDTLKIEVYDTGPGIPEDQLENIFLEFHQLGNPERDRHRGLGLGLAIVRRVADILGYPIEVRSRVKRGSCFAVTVPLTAEAPEEAAVSPAPARMLGTELEGRRVLVLDDDTTVLEAMRSLLERWRCKVVTTTSLEEAEEQMRRQTNPPELLIVDYRLREHASGLEGVSQLRKLIGANIPALVITGDTAPDRLREAEESGYPLLHKPVKPAKLRTVMRHLLNQ